MLTTVVLAALMAAEGSRSIPLDTYFPLVRGSSYEYRDRKSSTSSVVKILDVEPITTESAGTKAARFSRRVDMHLSGVDPILHEGLFIIGPKGIAERATAHSFLGDNTLTTTVLMFPLVVGTTWSDDGQVSRIVDVNATVKVPAGTFRNCVVVETKMMGESHESVYAPGVGLIKTALGQLVRYKVPGGQRKKP